MRTFNHFLESKQSVSLQFDDYYKNLRGYIDNFAAEYNDKLEDHKNTKVDFNKLRQLLTSAGYPNTHELLSSLQSGQWSRSILSDFFKFREDKGKTLTDYKDKNAWHELTWEIYEIMRILEHQLSSRPITADSANQMYDAIAIESKKNVDVIFSMIQGAISRVGTWGGSKVVVSPMRSGDFSDPITSASVKVANGDFSVFLHENKLHIDDVLDYGDTDFFHDQITQTDYFQLVQELTKPGSTSAAGKFITLYTARPKEDRERYTDATTVPAGIFLSNNPDHVSGIAVDMGERDIWRVRIDSNKVIITNDTPTVKYYQVVGSGEVPIKRITLVG